MMRKILIFNIFLILFLYFAPAQTSQNITFTHDGFTVYGTFIFPAGPGPHPVIIIAPGSGPNDRNGTIILAGSNPACLYPGLLNDTVYPYRDFAIAMADSGYAILRYDKLEYTYGSSLGTITFHKLWLPFESAVNYVKTRSLVYAGR